MRVRALRGVCIGVARHLVPGDTVDLPAAEVQYFTSIGAVELAPEEPLPDETVTEPVTLAKAAGKKEK